MPITHAGVCRFCGRPYRGRGQLYCSVECRSAHQRGDTPLPDRIVALADAAPRFVDHPQLTNEHPWAITSDWHCRGFSSDLSLRLLEVCAARGVDQLLIAGDFLNFDTLSRYPPSVPRPNIEDELEAAGEMMGCLAERFATILWIYGNHETRLERKLQLAFSTGSPLGRLVAPDLLRREVLTVSRYPYATIETPCGRYMVTHPKSFSDLAPNVAERLAIKFHAHILNTHGHHVGFRFDPSGKFMCWEIGGMMDGEKIGYRQMSVTTHRTWVGGFGILEAGHYQQYTMHPAQTRLVAPEAPAYQAAQPINGDG